MQTLTLDSVVRRTLLDRGMPIHYYAEYLFHSSACLRELTKDTLKVVNTSNLPIGEYGEVNLPADFVDDVAVSLDGQGILVPLPKNNSINPLRIHSTTTGQFVPQENRNAGESDNVYGIVGSWNAGWFWNVNEWGEPTGRQFGANGGIGTGYKVIKERRQIQMIGTWTLPNIILQYISNGQSIDNATQIDWSAFAAIQAYINWKSSPNAAIKDSPEAATYYNERRLLRANLNNISISDMKNSLRLNYSLGLKN